jgi:lysophospholipase L1-like esterase
LVRFRAVAVLGALAASVLMTLAPAPASAAFLTGQRVMIVGDSLTNGFGGDWTWRYWLWREVHRQGVPARFVGPSSLTYDGMRYEANTPWDSSHAAKGGTTLDEQLKLVPGEISTYHPDVLVVELGFNDVNHGDDAATASAQLQQLLTQAKEQSRGLRIVLVELPLSGSKPDVDVVTADVNARMAAWASTRGIEIAHTRTGEGAGTLVWEPDRDCFDGIHPNATGQTLIAHRVAQALHRAGVLPSAPQGVYHQRTWNPAPVPVLTSGRGSVHVSWNAAASQIRMVTVRVLVDGVAKTGWLPVSSTSTGVTVALPRGKHRVQLVPRRYRMIGAPGPGVYGTAG